MYVALLRAVNVGGTGKLPMARLLELCAEAGFADSRTYIASGNVIFRSAETARAARDRLEARLQVYAGKPVGVLVRTGAELARLVAENPFADRPGSRAMVLFTDDALPQQPLDSAVGLQNEEVRLGPRALFVFYPDGMGGTRLRLPSALRGTVRNMNTVARLAELAGEDGAG